MYGALKIKLTIGENNMYKITDIATLGTDYTVADGSGTVVGNIQLIPFLDLLSATMGPYTTAFGDYTSYIEQCKEVLTGIDEVDPNSILWYTTTDEEVDLYEVFEYAIKHKYSKIVLEHLEELE